jgi:hypothetical protein
VVRVISPTELLREAAEVLGPVRDDAVVIGAVAVQVALDGHNLPLTPTSDVDAGTSVERAPAVVSHLEANGFRRSDAEHEEGFTWIRGDFKVQLVRPFHPFPRPPANRMPVNNLVPELQRHRWLVAFEDDPDSGLFWAARPAALVALKEAAFGRTRPSGEKVNRDFSDVVLLFDNESERIADEASSDRQMQARVLRAVERLEEPTVVDAAVRELVATGHSDNPREGEATVNRSIQAIRAALQRSGLA